MHSAHTTFIGTPLPQHLLLSGQTWWGPHTWRDPSGNTVNDIHDPTSSAIGLDVSLIFAQHFPKLGPDLTDGTCTLHHQFACFLEAMGGVYEFKNPRVDESHLKKCPRRAKGEGGGAAAPPFDTPLLLRLVGGARRNLTKFLGLSLKVVPRPSEAFLVSFWTDEKPYNCIGSK